MQLNSVILINLLCLWLRCYWRPLAMM